VHTIRVTSYLGDMDDMKEVVVIGPYPDEADRDAAIERLDRLPDVRGNLDLEPSRIPPDAAVYSATAEQAAAADTLDALAAALYGR
jgi:hypothetical protein